MTGNACEYRETDVQALQQRCRQLLRQRDADRMARRQDMLRLERFEAQCESLGGSLSPSSQYCVI